MLCPMDKLGESLRQNTLVRIIERFSEEHAESHLKDLVIDEAGPGREIVVLGRRVINFGSDSFLALIRTCRSACDPGWGAEWGRTMARRALCERPRQHRRRAKACRMVRGRVDLDLPIGDAGQPGGDSRADRPPRRDRHGRNGPQLDAGSGQDRRAGTKVATLHTATLLHLRRRSRPCGLIAGFGLHRRRVQHERQDPADGGS